MQYRHAYDKGGDAMPVWVILGAIPTAVLVGSALLVFKKGVAGRRARTSGAWSEAEVDYKARHELVPMLEETLKAYAFRGREDCEPGTT
jgi:hypothetical protein